MQTETDHPFRPRDGQADRLSLTQQIQFLINEIEEQERQIEHLQLALRNSRTIGVALGILMATQRIPRRGAFEALAQSSQRLNRKLIQIAEHVSETGALPDV